MGLATSLQTGRAELHARLLGRRGEIEEALATRVRAIPGPAGVTDASYADGLRTALGAALDYALASLRLGESRAPAPPTVLLAQARMAARSGVGLDTVLRRYFAGYTLIAAFATEEAQGTGLSGPALTRVLQDHATLFERLIATVSEEHARELACRHSSAAARQAERVRRLLAGEPVDATGLAYPFEGSHLALCAEGPGAEQAIRGLAARLDRRLLLVGDAAGGSWAWLGSRERLDPAEACRLASDALPEGALLAIGEPGAGVEGWRLSHRQAVAALPVARRRGQPVTRYGEVALLASILQDDLLLTSLRELYLTPLRRERDRGEAWSGTLRAYFQADRNVASAAAALKVNRNTVANRLRAIEGAIGCPLGARGAQLEAALSLEELE